MPIANRSLTLGRPGSKKSSAGFESGNHELVALNNSDGNPSRYRLESFYQLLKSLIRP